MPYHNNVCLFNCMSDINLPYALQTLPFLAAPIPQRTPSQPCKNTWWAELCPIGEQTPMMSTVYSKIALSLCTLKNICKWIWEKGPLRAPQPFYWRNPTLESVAIFLPETVGLQREAQNSWFLIMWDTHNCHTQTGSGQGTKFKTQVRSYS